MKHPGSLSKPFIQSFNISRLIITFFVFLTKVLKNTQEVVVKLFTTSNNYKCISKYIKVLLSKV